MKLFGSRKQDGQEHTADPAGGWQQFFADLVQAEVDRRCEGIAAEAKTAVDRAERRTVDAEQRAREVTTRFRAFELARVDSVRGATAAAIIGRSRLYEGYLNGGA